MPHIALVTARAAEDLDDDLAPLAAALERSGARASITCWDDPEMPWSSFDAAVLRSAWDYPERLGEFIAWARAAAGRTSLHNPPEIIEWNADKTYLADLLAAGVPTVPTVFVSPGDDPPWPNAAEVVVKPSISAGSRHTARFADRAAAQRLVERIWASGRIALVQPYLPAVDDSGEQALVFFSGDHSHAFRKGPILRPGAPPTEDLFAPEEIGPTVATPDQIEIAAAAVAAIEDLTGHRPLYARVDLVTGPAGPVVLELELIEPSVYHAMAPGSAERFATAILHAL